MRVVQLYFPGPFGGAEQVILYGSEALARQGLEVSVIVVQETRRPAFVEIFKERADSLNIETKKLISKGRLDLTLLLKLKALLKETNPHIVHAHCHKAAFYGLLCKPKRARFVYTSHGFFPDASLKCKIYTAIEIYVMRRSGRVIAVSQSLKRELVHGNVPSDIISVLENFLPVVAKGRKVTGNDKMNLLFVGRLTKRKGCHHLISAISKIMDKINVELTIVGDGKERKSLAQMVSDLKLDAIVKFEGFKNDVSRFLKKCDALIFPSLKEGFPIVLIEACCSGVPILSSNIEPAQQIVRDGVNGILFAPGSAKSIASAILLFNEDKQAYLSRSKRMANGFMKRFDRLSWARCMKNIYMDLVCHKRR